MPATTPLPHVEALRTALHPRHESMGATLTEFGGWSMPLRYSGERAEHLAVRAHAGLFDLSHMAQLVVTGQEAGRFLDHALVSRLSALDAGRARYTLMCHPSGGVVDDMIVYRLADDRFWIVSNAANRGVVLSELRDRSDGYAVTVEDTTSSRALVAIQGPDACRLLGSVVMSGSSLSAQRYYSVAEARLEGRPVLLARTGYTGEDGFEISCAAEDALAVWDALVRAGSDEGLLPGGLAARDTLRLEAGMPLYGNELAATRDPYCVGLGRVVDLDKPWDFVGRAELERLSRSEPDRVLVGLRLSGRRIARHGHRVLDARGHDIGAVTSGAPSPTLDAPIAMALIDARSAAPATQVRVEIRGTEAPARITSLPFYRRTR